jgi:tetratricopeptide (TPR) repeat protein
MKTIRVFLSHTSDMAQFPGDRPFVQAALDAVARARMAPVDMRYFAARDGMPVDYCRQQVRECDVYVAIVGFRYGSVVEGEAVSYTESEFLAASSAGLPRLVFLLAESARVPELTDADIGPVERFRERLSGSRLLLREFGSSDSLELEIFHALSELEGRLLGTSPSGVQSPAPMAILADLGDPDSIAGGRGSPAKARQPDTRPLAAAPSPVTGAAEGSSLPAVSFSPVVLPSKTGGLEQENAPVRRSSLPGRKRRWQRTGPSPAQVPAEPPGFAGRATELRWLQSLIPGERGDTGEKPRSCPVVLITGTAGVGKTTLAIRFAGLAASRFPDGQLYVNLRGFSPGSAALSPGTALQGFLDALGVSPRQVPPAVEAQSALLRSLLDGKRMLLVLDNARNADQVRPLLPASPGCMVMVTSRSQLVGLVAAEGALPLALGMLTADEATELLAARLGEERVAAEPDAAAMLARQSAGLPLALSVACARALTRGTVRLADLAAELASARDRLDALSTGEVTTDLRAVFSWSVDKLSDQAAQTFLLIGLHPGPEITAAAAASLTAAPIGRARAALPELIRASLLTEDVAGRFSCHDLLRAYAAELAAATLTTAERDLATRRVLNHYLHSAHAAAARLYPAHGTVPLPAPLDGVAPEAFSGTGAYERAIAWFSAEDRVLANLIEQAAAQHQDEHCWKLAWYWAPLLNRRGRTTELLAVTRTAVLCADRLGDRDALAHAHCELGNATARHGDYRAADEHLRKALELFTELGDTASVGQTQYRLGVLLAHQERWDEALAHAVEALRLRRSLADRAPLAYSENMVGWILAHTGQPDAALSYCRRALGMHTESGSRTGMADTLDSIAFAYGQLADYERSIAHYEQALEIYRLLGDPQGEATAWLDLGDIQLASGQPDAARRSWERSRALLAEIPGADMTGAISRINRHGQPIEGAV